MKSTHIACYLICLMVSVSAFAQKEIKFNSINTGGIIHGEIGVYGMLQTVNGVQYKKWFGGIGTVYDPYYYKTFPVFLDVRRYIDKQNRIPVYADAGYDFPGKNVPGNEISYYTSFHFTGGLYTDMGIGYRIKFTKHTSFLLTGGYSYKKLHDRVITMSCPFFGPCYESVFNYNYGFGRLVFKAGFIF